jgi:chemotaxis protein methyltransferase CheR
MLGFPGTVAPMTERERKVIGDFIESEFGIKMPASKKGLLEGRLGKRVAACGLRTYGAYFDFITNAQGLNEYLYFKDLVTTHVTSFFREPKHFDFLRKKVLPSLCAQGYRREISILCAACSTGEEAYTLAMIMDSTLREMGRGDMTFTVEGVDLSNKAVAIAERGVYLADGMKKVPEELRRDYFMTSKDKGRNLCRIVPELRQNMEFHAGNLFGDLELLRPRYEIVFCRNVLIYFDRSNQRKVIARLLGHMNDDSFLFLGHSETMLSYDFPLKSVTHSVYRKKN